MLLSLLMSLVVINLYIIILNLLLNLTPLKAYIYLLQIHIYLVQMPPMSINTLLSNIPLIILLAYSSLIYTQRNVQETHSLYHILGITITYSGNSLNNTNLIYMYIYNVVHRTPLMPNSPNPSLVCIMHQLVPLLSIPYSLMMELHSN